MAIQPAEGLRHAPVQNGRRGPGLRISSRDELGIIDDGTDAEPNVRRSGVLSRHRGDARHYGFVRSVRAGAGIFNEQGELLGILTRALTSQPDDTPSYVEAAPSQAISAQIDLANAAAVRP
jgi:hypothetical protein